MVSTSEILMFYNNMWTGDGSGYICLPCFREIVPWSIVLAGLEYSKVSLPLFYKKCVCGGGGVPSLANTCGNRKGTLREGLYFP